MNKLMLGYPLVDFCKMESAIKKSMDDLKNLLNSKKGRSMHPFKHIKARPGTYIGSVVTNDDVYIHTVIPLDTDQEDGVRAKEFIGLSKIVYNQGLERIIMEILSNSKDNYWSSKGHVDMTYIKITIEKTSGKISIENDGLPIPVILAEYTKEDLDTGKITKEEKYPAEKFFGEVNAGTNFDKKDVKKKSSGLNGLGGKLTNVFSKTFIIEIGDHINQKSFKMVFSKNGLQRTKPRVEDYNLKRSFTRITFIPDYDAFHYPFPETGMIDDLFYLIKRHAYDTAAVIPVVVKFNGKNIKFNNIEDYLKMYFNNKKLPMIVFKSPNGDEVGIIQKELESFDDSKEVMDNISFINGIRTKNGGSHVNKWKQTIFSALKAILNARKGKKELKELKFFSPYFTIFVRAETYEDINFSEQTKDTLTEPKNYPIYGDNTPQDKIRKFNDDMKKQLQKCKAWDFVKHLDAKFEPKTRIPLKKQMLNDDHHRHANLFGPYNAKKHSEPRMGFICEGDTAFNLFISLQSALPTGKDYCGGLAIRGKINSSGSLDISDMEKKVILTRIQDFYGLRHELDYSIESNRHTILYDKAMAMTDADDDGIHIKGLLMAYFSRFKGLLESGFFCSFNTYNVILQPKIKSGTPYYFYSQKEYNDWVEGPGKKIDLSKYNARYIKGLGGHEDGEEYWYVEKEDQAVIKYVNDPHAIENIKLGFGKDDANKLLRKNWIKNSIPTPLNNVKVEPIPYRGRVTVSDFINKDLINFHIATLERALPRLIDGFKHSQRQALYAAINGMGYNKKDYPMPNLVSDTTTLAGYHHAPESMAKVIAGMALNYVGTNNIPYFVPKGKFGNRITSKLSGIRYLKISLERVCQSIFKKDDEPILKRIVDSGSLCDYEYYLPVVPMILINGVDGIASGYVSRIPAYNPKDILGIMREWLNSDDRESLEFDELIPWYRGFKGKIYRDDGSNRFLCDGILEKNPKKNNEWVIREIPVGIKISKIDERLEHFRKTVGQLAKENGKKSNKEEKEYRKIDTYATVNGTHENEVHIIVKTANGFIPDIDTRGNFDFLRKKITTTQLNALDAYGVPINYKSAIDMLLQYCEQRLPYYNDRRKYWIKFYENEKKIEQNRLRFIRGVIDGDIDMSTPEAEVIEYLEENDFFKVSSKKDENSIPTPTYEYLLSMQIRSMTENRVKKIEEEIKKIQKNIDLYKKSTPESLWLNDLDEFEKSYDIFLKDIVKRKDKHKKSSK